MKIFLGKVIGAVGTGIDRLLFFFLIFNIGENHFQEHNGSYQHVILEWNEVGAQRHYLEGMFQVKPSSRAPQDRASHRNAPLQYLGLFLWC